MIKVSQQQRLEASTKPASPLLEINQVSLSLQGCPILQNVQFSMQEGEWVSVNIEEGLAGHALARLITREYEPSGGKVFFLGTLLQQWQGQELMCRRCVLPSRWCSPLRGTVAEVVEQGIWLSAAEVRHRLRRELLELLELQELAEACYLEQPERVRQLALLARVLAQVWDHPGPRLVVIDQGLSALSADDMHLLLGRLKHFLRRQNIAFLVLWQQADAEPPQWADQQWQLNRSGLHRAPDREARWWRFWQ